MRAIRKREYLTLLSQAQNRHKRRRALLDTADKGEILAVSEVIDNLLKGNLPLNQDHRRKLKRYKNSFRSIASKRVPLKTKRVLIQQRGGFISAILPLALSLLGGIGKIFTGGK